MEKKGQDDERRWEEKSGKGHQTGRRVKWVVKNSNMVFKLTKLINYPLKEQMLAKKISP